MTHNEAMHSLDMRLAAQRYIDQGMTLVRLKPNSKEPVSAKGWQNSSPKAAEFSAGENIGVQLGAKSGRLVDLDFDIREAAALGSLPCFFGDLPYFSRRSRPIGEPGHRLVRCSDAPDAVFQFNFTSKAEQAAIRSLNLSKSVVLELRAGKGYTVFPPSVIEGDPLEFGCQLDVPEIGWRELRTKAGLLAFVAFAAACFPNKGDRDNFCFHLAGVLVHLGVDVEIGEEILEAVARLKGDDVHQRRGKVRMAAAKRDGNEPVTGLPEFLRHIGMEACEKRLRAWLQAPVAEGEDEMPVGAILVGRPDIHLFLDELQQAVSDKLPHTIFKRAGSLVRLRTLEAMVKENGVVRHPGVVEIAGVEQAWLRVATSRAGIPFAARRGNKFRLVEPPKEVNLLMATAAESPFDRLRGISMTPTIARDAPGYDAESGLYLAFPEGMFPPASMEPTRAEAEAALSRLAHPLRGFPFKGPGSKSVVLSMFLSGVCRGALRTCPLHGVSAPTPGTGKTKLIDMAGLLVTGTKPSHATHSPSSEEMEKRLVSILRCGDQVINLDNAIGPLEGEFLSAILTSDTVQARILGESERVHLDTRVLLLANGNNLRLRGDMVRRAVVCRIDAGVEQPDQRQFDFDPVAEIAANRTGLVTDALVVLRGYIAAGRPLPVEYRRLGSFEDWDLVRGALIWLGQDDPVLTQAAARDDDDEREMLGDILLKLFDRFENAMFRTRDLDGGAYDDVRGVFQMYLRNNEWNAKAASMLLSRLRDRPWNGLLLDATKDEADTRVWSVKGRPKAAQSEFFPEDTPF
jgi:hypothetical protein